MTPLLLANVGRLVDVMQTFVSFVRGVFVFVILLDLLDLFVSEEIPRLI